MSVLQSRNNKTRGGLGPVCATGIFVEWKASYVSDDGEAMVKFLFVDNVLEDSSSANAQTITNNLDKCELDIQKMMSLVSDGTKVMTGERTGVAAD